MPVATANGKEFTFPDGTTPEQMGQAIDEFFSSSMAKEAGGQAPSEKMQDGIFAGLSEEQKAAIIRDNRMSGRGSGGNANRYRRAADLERLRMENPYLAEEIEGMSGGERFLVGAGEGFADVARGVSALGNIPASGIPFVDAIRSAGRGAQSAVQSMGIEDPNQPGMDALRGQSDAATVGRVVGNAAPFLVPAGAAGTMGTLPARLAAMGGIGAAEGAIVSQGQGASGGEVAAGAGVGLLLGAGGEVLIPIVNSLGRRLIQKLTGRSVPQAVTPAGAPTPEFQQVLDESGITFEQVVKSATDEAQLGQTVTPQIPGQAAGAAPTVNMNAVQEMAGDAASGRLRKLPENVQVNRERQAALESFGLGDAPLGAVSDNQAFIELSAGLASIPGSAMAVERKEFLNRTGEAANQLIQDYGGKLDKATLSDDIRDYLTKTRDDLYSQESALYDEVRDLIPNVKVNARPLADYVRGIADELGGVSELSGLDKEILRVANMNPTYKRLDALRKEVGQALGDKMDKSVYGTKETSILKDRYTKLTQLQEGVASVYGDASEKWKLAKNATRLRKDLEDSTVKLFGKDMTKAIMPAIGQSVKKLAKGDYAAFDKAMSMLPAAQRREAVASALDEVFRSGDGFFSPIIFNKWYKDLARNGSTRARLEAVLPDKGKRLHEFYKATEGLANLQRNVLPNGRIQAMLDSFDRDGGMLSKLTKTGGQILAAEGLGTAAGVPGVGTASVITRAIMEKKTPAVEAAQKLIQDQTFIDAVKAAGMNRPKNVVDIAEKRLQKSKSFRDWLETQPADTRNSILTIGLIPWLAAEDQ